MKTSLVNKPADQVQPSQDEQNGLDGISCNLPFGH